MRCGAEYLLGLATKRKLERCAVEAFCAQQGITLSAWLDMHAKLVASGFISNKLSWDEGSSAFNSVWPAFVSDNELTQYFFNVYLAFEDAETLESEESRAQFTRNRLQNDGLWRR